MALPMLPILLACPYPLESPRGNSVSANRILGILEELGHATRPVSGREALSLEGSALIALHARKSATAIESFHQRQPSKPVIILLTGSDLYADLLSHGEARATVLRTFAIADRLVVAQASSLTDIPAPFRAKAVVVPKSLLTPVPRRQPTSDSLGTRIVLPSHLRPAKAPLLVLEALAQLPQHLPIQIDHYGTAEDASLGAAASVASQRPHSRYHWHGNVPHHDVLASFAAADGLLNTSRVEGGANVLCEAIQMGLPCLATNIAPNVGMLGEHYPGLFPVDDATALASLLERFATDKAFIHTLTEATAQRAPLFTREAERDAWQAIITEVTQTG